MVQRDTAASYFPHQSCLLCSIPTAYGGDSSSDGHDSRKGRLAPTRDYEVVVRRITYIEMHKWAGRGYPDVLMSWSGAGNDQLILKRRTDWFLVRSERGGWRGG